MNRFRPQIIRKVQSDEGLTITLSKLSKSDGDGYLAVVTEFPGCMGDGETEEEAVADAQKAILEWLDEFYKNTKTKH